MKSILSISILVVFAYIQFFNGMMWMSYEINKSEIIENFCVNKEKPKLHCEGKCHMKEMMLTQETDDEGSILMTIPQIELYLTDIGLEVSNSTKSIKRYNSYTNFYSFKFLNEREIPPKA